MNKLISYLAIITLFFTVACSSSSSLKWKPLTKKDLDKYGLLLDSVVAYNKAIDSITTYTLGQNLTYDTSSGRLNTSSGRLSFWTPTIDTSDVIVRYVFNWEEGEIETVTGKIVHPRSAYGFYLGKPDSSDSKFYKVSNGVWIPVEWPKDIVELYIRPKE